jgi:8-oxo-dGTP pyrophosphatase MutT (NUDIX family)
VTSQPAYPVVDSESLYEGRIVSMRRDHVRMSDGTVADREVVAHPGAVAIAALDDEDRLVMVRQYRHPVREWLEELPAGLLDVAGEPALRAAQRELAEEANLQAGQWHVLLDMYPSPGFSTEAIRVYLARELSAAPRNEDFRSEHEEITMTVHRVAVADAVQRALSGAITNAAAVAGVLAVAHERAAGWGGLRPADAPWPARPAS